MDGVPASRVKDKMADLESRKAELEARLKDGQDSSILIHPRMANYYRDEVARLREALNGDDGHEAMAVMRKLIDRIVLTPVEDETGRKILSIDLYGHLANILSLANRAKTPLDRKGPELGYIKLVAGVGFEPTTFGL